ncbi:MAG: xanthine dehydrogenase family protein subunit M [Caldilinea sp. CFX5]|nr:xanthine dehydrogenase family protein subunit M [Caldilinea sp. CFX5]
MRTFAYARATNLTETITLLDHAENGHTRPLAGGTDLLTLMKADIVAPAQLIDIKRLGDLPRGISETANGVTLGALTTLAEIERSDLLRTRYPLLVEAVAQAATPQLRNMATIGGNLLQRPRCWYFRNHLFHCWLKGGADCPAQTGENQHHALFGGSPCVAVHPSDLASALVALDATVRLRGPQGERTLPIAEFFALPEDGRRRETTIGDDELLLGLDLPTLPAGAQSTYLKAMDRKVWAFALVGVAAVIQVANGQVNHARLVLSGVAPIPWRATAAEQALLGATITDEQLKQIVDLALQGAQPLRHNSYKAPLARALVQRALTTVTAVN